MESLFGIPIGQLTATLVVAFLIGAAIMTVVALRNRVLFKMAVRNIPRRRAQTMLIVLGLMLATLLFSSSFATGDTLAHSIRVQALERIGFVDEVLFSSELDETGRSLYFDQGLVERFREALAGAPVDGIALAAQETVPAVAQDSGRSEPRVEVLGFDPAQMSGFDALQTAAGDELDLNGLRQGQTYLSEEAAANLDVAAGDLVLMFFGEEPTSIEVAGIYAKGANPAEPESAVMRLDHMVELLGKPGLARWIIVSNRGGLIEGAESTEEVVAALEGINEELGFQVDEIKQEALDQADAVGGAFATIFLVFGNFSIIAGVLLIFLIFVMLAAERKRELGIARAVGGQRSHIVQLFTFEGALYAVASAALGSVLGILVSLGVVWTIASAVANVEDADLSISFAFRWQSVLLAFVLGMVTTFAVVLFSAGRVSALNIVRAIRDIPEPPGQRERLRTRFQEPFAQLRKGFRRVLRGDARGLGTMTFSAWAAGVGFAWATVMAGWGAVVLGLLLTSSGVSFKQLSLFMLGTSFVIIGVPLALRHTFHLADRPAYTIAGLGLVSWWLLPFDVVEMIFPDLGAGIEMFILSGVMLVFGAVWTVMYNSDLMAKALLLAFGRSRALAPVLRTSIAYPMAARFRTGMALAMFSLVVFTLVVMGFIIAGFSSAFDDTRRTSGGFDVSANVVLSNPIGDLEAALAAAGALDVANFEAVGSLSGLPVKVRQVGVIEEEKDLKDWFITGVNEAYVDTVTYKFQMKDERFVTDEAVWQALHTEPNVVIVSAFLVPSRSDFNVGDPDLFLFEGFYRDDEMLPEVYIEAFDFAEGTSVQLRVIGVLENAALFASTMITSHASLAPLAPVEIPVLRYSIRLVDPTQADLVVAALEDAFAENGLRADALEELVRKQTLVNLTFNRLIQGFMALGLVIGIAALGVIAARSVVERRGQIGVLRAIGFQRNMVQLLFLMESSFIALLGIALGVALASGLSVGIIRSIGENVEGVRYEVPWMTIVIVVGVAYGASLLMTFLPARQAANVYPAEALRFAE